MTHTFKITNIKVFSNAIEKDRICFVSWLIEFEKQGFISVGAGETVLDTSSTVENFIPIENVTQEQIKSWVINKEGGDSFMEVLTKIHETNLDLQILKSTSVNIDLPFVQKPEQSVITYDLQETN